ncbi:MAG: hypothetical protein ACFE8L_02810 [Candidatus Hodarchaeota archaeon]
MVNTHSQSFFGQSTGLTIQSTSKAESFIFLKCIKKKSNGTWEKPSQGEGKTVKCSLDEIVMILRVLDRKIKSWSSYHDFNNAKTQISFQWEEGKDEKVWINIGNYSKMLNYAQVEILRLLLEHILKEKIEYATSPKISVVKNKSKNIEINTTTEIEVDPNKSNKKNSNIIETSQIEGNIEAETKNALLINFTDGNEIWVPRSIIRSQNNMNKELTQKFLIDTWFLKKNNLSYI